MIVGMGTDLVEIKRVKGVFDKFGLHFVKKILGFQEIKYLEKMPTAFEEQSKLYLISFLAKRFAAKEAIGKALGIGMRFPMCFRLVDIVNCEKGRPVVILHEDLYDYFEEKKFKVHISISDEKTFAHALAIIEK